MYRKRFTLVLLSILLITPTLVLPASGQEAPTAATLAPVRAAVQKSIDRGKIPGAVVYVSQRGKPLLFEALGQASADRPMTTDTLFAIASMTKPITSVAVMKLVEAGLVRLDDPLARYLPEFANLQVMDQKSGQLTASVRAVTIRDLLTHTSGIAYGLNPPESLKDEFNEAQLADGLNPQNPTLEANIQKVARLPLAHQPGEAWTYGMNTDVLGRVVEAASGQLFDRFLSQQIFKPLGMNDTSFQVTADKANRLVTLYTPGDEGRVYPLKSDPATFEIVTISPRRVLGPVNYLSGGAGLVSTAADYARFLQMLLNQGELEGVRLLKPETVRKMTRNQIGELDCAYTIHGDKFGLGFGIVSTAHTGDSVATPGSYSWGGMYHTFFWVDPARELVALVMTQIYPWGDSTLWPDFQKAVYDAIGPAPAAPADEAPVISAPATTTTGRFLKETWFEMGAEHANPAPNNRFRVNDPLAALDPDHGKRNETKGNGLLQIPLDEPLAGIEGAELALELWGGHPGTARKRVSVNGRNTYEIPEVGTAAGNCTHLYPIIRLERSDLVQAHNAFQFACDRGDSFWGHFIVDNAALRVELPPSHRTLNNAGLADFNASLEAAPQADGTLILSLKAASANQLDRIASVHFQGHYESFDENGDGASHDWHGMTKNRQPYGHLGTATKAPFELSWDTSWVPPQADVAIRASVRFKDHPELLYETPVLGGLSIGEHNGTLKRFRPTSLPKPFWSRANNKKSCQIDCDLDPASIASAELCLVIWDGGVEKVENPLTLNGQPLPFKSDGRHDVKYLRLSVDPAILNQGDNTFQVLSDTTHHGIEILLPGPELFIQTRADIQAAANPDHQRSLAMNRAGDPALGKILFESKALNCVACHKVNSQGGAGGPDLSLVAGKLDRTHLIESVLDPSAQILEGFRTTLLELADGRTLTGVISAESETELTLHDAQGQALLVPVDQVERRAISDTSLMPRDLCGTLSPAQFTDLVAYLETLREGRKLTPGEGTTGALELPPGFKAEVVATGLNAATALDVSPDGRVFVCEQTGALRVVKNGKLLPEPFCVLPVAATWERGLIGVALDPGFPATPLVYVCYVAAAPYPHHVISRFTASGDQAAPGSEQVLFEGDDQTTLGGHKIDGHQGGALHFGLDGKLYVGIGEQTAEKPSQSLQSLLGKILRLNPDGTIPDDNPFIGQTTGKYRAIWALGCRNPFAFAVQPETGRLFINDVGGKAEEINEGRPGANYGWPTADHGPTADSRFTGPLHHYPTACITGGAFADEQSPWPEQYRGRYFFADFNHGFLKHLDPDHPEQANPFATGLRRPVDIRFAPDGSLYVLLRDAWVIDNQFHGGTGTLLRIEHEF